MRLQPAFSSVAILTLALGIGATTAVFTVVYGVLLRPLPYRDPARLVTLQYGHHGTVSPWFSPANYRDYPAPTGAFAATAALAPIGRPGGSCRSSWATGPGRNCLCLP